MGHRHSLRPQSHDNNGRNGQNWEVNFSLYFSTNYWYETNFYQCAEAQHTENWGCGASSLLQGGVAVSNIGVVCHDKLFVPEWLVQRVRRPVCGVRFFSNLLEGGF